MKGITLRKDGRYVIRKTINGIRLIRYANNINEAKKIYTQLKKSTIKQDTNKKPITLEEWSQQWLENYKKPFVKPQTLCDISGIVKQINKTFGKIILKQLSAQEIQIFLNKIPKSRQKERIQTYFNALLQKAEDLEYISKNPFKMVIRDKKGKWRRNAFNFEEQKKILQAIKGTVIEHEILIYLMTGCRPNELPPNKNFNFDSNTIMINGTKNINAQCRIIPMSENFANYIKPYIEKYNILNKDFVRENFYIICKKLKIENPLLYRLRHTFATNHFTLGTNAKYVQSWLGHYSVSITMDTYTDIDPTSSKKKIKELYNNFYYEP